MLENLVQKQQLLMQYSQNGDFYNISTRHQVCPVDAQVVFITVQEILFGIMCLDRSVSSPVYSNWLRYSSPSKSTTNGPKLYNVWECCLIEEGKPATLSVGTAVHNVYPPVNRKDAHPSVVFTVIQYKEDRISR
jgi:hypothetical protein